MMNDNYIIDENIKRIFNKWSLFEQCLDSHFSDKMSIIAKGNYESLPEIFVSDDDFSKIAKPNVNFIKLRCAELLYKFVFENKEPSDLLLPPRKQQISIPSVAYLKTPACEEAYFSFLSIFEKCNAEICTDFVSVCESVYNQKCDYCIIPVENSTDGRLSGFQAMLSKYELFICAIKDIMNSDYTLCTRFALCSSSSQCLFTGDTIRCRLVFNISKSNTLFDIAQGAHYFKLDIVRTDSVFELYHSDESKCDFELEGNIQNLMKYFFYLYLISAEYTLKGIYN